MSAESKMYAHSVHPIGHEDEKIVTLYYKKQDAIRLEAPSRCHGSDKRKRSVVSIHNCSYTVKVNTKICGKPVKKTILKNLNAVFKPGMNAILGPTGCGKSSFLDVLAGRKDPRGLSGDLLIDGAPPPHNFKCMVGYVVQDDVVLGTLTVKENFQFSAALRLPSNMSNLEREERVSAVIEELGLVKCANTKVGNEFIRGVSGGERKRTNIGMELIISPPVLFLDEPTTGLDAGTANSVMQILRSLAQKGRIIVFSIHQPRFSIFNLFDHLFLLSLGEAVYQGPASEALDYFKTAGYVCEEHNNPSDFLLDVVHGDYNETSTRRSSQDGTSVEVHEKLLKAFQESPWYQRASEETSSVWEKYKKNQELGIVIKLPPVKYPTSFGRQFIVLSGRMVKNLLRNPQMALSQTSLMIVFALMVGLVYFQLDTTIETGFQNRSGAFFFIIMNVVFGNLSAVELFIRERAFFVHENVSGFYRVSAYFLAKVLCDILPLRLVPLLLFSVIAYFMTGLRSGTIYFFYFVLNLLMTNLSAAGVCFAMSSSFRIVGIANLVVALVYVIMMLFSGLLVNLSTIANWIVWIKWLSIFRYSLEALSINELRGNDFCDTIAENVTVCQPGDAFLEKQKIQYNSDWDLWIPIIAQAVIGVVLLLITYIQLLCMKKLR